MIKDQTHPDNKAQSSRLVLVAALLLVVVVPLWTGALLSWHSMGELDVWLHQKVGQDILAGQGMSGLNTYSYTEPDHAWNNHEWLFQILIATTGPGSDDLAAGINRWNILRLFLTVLLLTVLLLGDRPWRAPPLVLLWLAPGIFLGVALLWSRILLRPELLSYALLILLVRCAERPAQEPWNFRLLISPRSREGLAFGVTLIWAQLHGFSALAPVIWLLAGLLGYVPHSRFQHTSPLRLAAGTGWLVLALLLTPNGWQGLIYPLQALGQFSSATVDLHSTISELQPLLQTPDGFHLTLMAFKLSLAWGVMHIILTWNQRNLLRIILWLLAAVASVAAQRNLGFYAITFAMLHTSDGYFQHLKWGFRKFKVPSFAAILPGVLLTVAALWFWSALVHDDFYLAEGQSRRFGGGPTVARYPFQAVDILARTHETPVFANVDAASLTLSRGMARVFIDGRTEAYSPQTWQQYLQLRQAGPDALKILDQTGTSNILLTLGGQAFHPLLQTLLKDPRWAVRHADPAGVLLTRSSAPPAPGNLNALEPFARLQSKKPDNSLSITRQADLLGAQATLQYLAGRPGAQEAFLRQGIALRPEHPLLNHNLGNLLLQKGLPAPALACFRQALKTNPRLAGSALNTGVCLMNLQDFTGAERMFEKAISLQPDNFQAWVNHSLALQQLGQHQEAFKAMQEAVQLNPRNPRLRQALQDMKAHL